MTEQIELPVIASKVDTDALNARLAAQAERLEAASSFLDTYWKGVGELTPEMIASWNGGAK